MRGSDTTEAEVGFNVAAMKRSFGSFNFGMGVDSTEIFPCRERRMRIYDALSLEIKPRNPFAEHLVGLIGILSFQGCIALALEPIMCEL